MREGPTTLPQAIPIDDGYGDTPEHGPRPALRFARGDTANAIMAGIDASPKDQADHPLIMPTPTLRHDIPGPAAQSARDNPYGQITSYSDDDEPYMLPPSALASGPASVVDAGATLAGAAGRDARRAGGKRGAKARMRKHSRDASHGAKPGDPSLEPSRALALADVVAQPVNAGARLISLAYRLGVPGATLAAPFRKPTKLRLLATVENPLAGNKVAGMALRAGHFLVHGVKLPIAQVDFAGAGRLTPPFERVVHGFAWLGDLEAAGPREALAPVAERILLAWLAAHPHPPARPGKGPAWSIANTGDRLVAWLVHAPLILSSPDKALRARILATIAETARWLDRNVSRAEDRLAEVAGWAGIIAAGLLLPDGGPRRIYGEAGLIHGLGELVNVDGGVLSRSPIDQMEAIATLVRLIACYRAVRRDPPPALAAMLALMVPPLLTLMHGDGTLGSWQGGWAVSAEVVSALITATGVRARPLRDARHWGYQRVVAGKTMLMFDAAPPPLGRHTRHGCASTLAFELSHAGQRIIVNCGGAMAAGGLMPVRLEQGLRATAAHSTLTLDDTNSTAVLINGGLGGGVSEVEIDRRALAGEAIAARAEAARGEEAAPASLAPSAPGLKGPRGNWGATRLEASHDGYAGRYGLIHRRILILRDDGTELRGEDVLLPRGRRTKHGVVGFAIRFHLGAGIEVGTSEDKQGVGIALADGSYWQFRIGDGEVSVEDSIWADGEGHPVPVQQLVVQGMVSRGGGSFAWLFKKMR